MVKSNHVPDESEIWAGIAISLSLSKIVFYLLG